MKYVAALLAGLVAGMLMFAAAVYYNPFKGRTSVSPLAVGSNQLLSLSYTAVPAESILFTNDGESISAPYPLKAAELWEPTLRNSRILVVELANSRGEPAGIGIKFSSDSEDTRLLDAQALVDSAWHIFMPGRGTLFVDQRENYWAYLRDIVVEARWNSADSWRGVWNRVMTTGPNALGTARVVGGNGAFAGIETEAVESLNATAYSARSGPVAMDGNLTISLPSQSSSQASTRN